MWLFVLIANIIFYTVNGYQNISLTLGFNYHSEDELFRMKNIKSQKDLNSLEYSTDINMSKKFNQYSAQKDIADAKSETFENFFKDVNKLKKQAKFEVETIVNSLKLKKSNRHSSTIELENLEKLMKKIRNEPQNILHTLEEIEYLVHQYQAAITFVNIGGLDVILSLLESSDINIVSAAALVLGSAMQGNPDVQNLALQRNVGSYLLPLIQHNSSLIQARSLYALSCYIRHSPLAQREFIFNNGFNKLAVILKSFHTTRKLKLKVVNIVYDLVLEYQTAELSKSSENDYETSLKIKVYQRIPMDELIKKNKYCHLVPELLFEDDFDTLQKVVAAMNTLLPYCSEEYKEPVIALRIQDLHKMFHPNSKAKHAYSPNDIFDEELSSLIYNGLDALNNAL